MTNLILRIHLVFLIFVTLSGAQDFSSKHFKIEKLSDGIYAAIHSFGGYAICNAGIIDLGDKLLVFDTFLTVEAAEDLRKTAESLTGKPVAYVINSHAHNDHIRGNQVFRPNSVIISTSNIRDQIKNDEPEQIQYEKENAPDRLSAMKKGYEETTDEAKRREYKMWIGYYEGMIKSHSNLVTTLPDITFEDSLVFHGSERDGILIAYSTAHTDEDIALYLPEEKVMFTGDLVFNQMHPYLPNGNPENLKKTLNTLLKKPISIVVPGHGEVGNSETIMTMINYIDMVDEVAHTIKASGESIDDSPIERIPESYRSWNFPRFFSMNLKFMYKRLK